MTDLDTEARRLVATAGEAGIPLRLIGSLAVALRCPAHASLAAALGRRPPRDIDLVASSRHEAAIERLLGGDGYTPDPRLRHSREFGVKRLIFHRPAAGNGGTGATDGTGGFKVDVFLDQLVMAHTVDFAGRLELDGPTVTLADLLLSKLQIHEITENDLIDTALLLAEHDLVRGPAAGGIDLDRVTGVLGGDWGFHHSARRNLAALAAALGRWPALPAATATLVRERITRLDQALDRAPKTRRWRLRARVGERLRWYEDVEEVDGVAP